MTKITNECILLVISNNKFYIDIEYSYIQKSNKTFITVEVTHKDNDNIVLADIDFKIDYIIGNDYNPIRNLLIKESIDKILKYCKIIE